MTNSTYYCSYLDPETLDNGELLEYAPNIRRYWFILHEHGQDSGVKQPLLYFPWCGKKLPLTINNFFDKKGRWDELKIPEEFRTDEWWKKQNL